MMSARDLTLGLNPKFAAEGTREHIALSAAFVLAYWALAALGRDVMFNHNANADQTGDVIGAILPYIRVGACGFAVLVVAASSGLTWALSKVPLAFAPFCLWALVTVGWTDSPKDTLRAAFTLIAAWVAMPMIVHRIGMVQAARLSIAIVAWVCVASFCLAVLAPEIGRHNAADLLQSTHEGRWRGIFSHKNGLGPWAAYGTVLLLFYGDLMRVPALFRWSAWACAVACLAFCGSVTSLILASVCLAIFIVFVALRRYSWTATLIGAGIAALSLWISLDWVGDAILNGLGRDVTFSGRADIWKMALGYVAERPWTGYGYASLGGPDFLARMRMIFLQTIPGPESGYIDLALESGLVGCVLFFIPYFASIRNGFEWLKYVQFADRRAIEVCLIVLLSTFVEAVAETNALIATGYDGVLCFGAFFSLLTAPRSPDSIYRKDFRLAKYWPATKERRSRAGAPPDSEPTAPARRPAA